MMSSRMWCHEWFDLPEAPDIVTFSKKMLTGGLYHKPELRPKQAWRIFNTWVGDPSKVRVTHIKIISKSSVSSSACSSESCPGHN